MSVSGNVGNSIRWIDPNPRKWTLRLLKPIHGTYGLIICSQIYFLTLLKWCLTSESSDRDFYYSLTMYSLYGLSFPYQAFFLRNRERLKKLYEELRNILRRLEHDASQSQTAGLLKSSRFIGRATAAVAMGFVSEGIVTVIRPVPDSLLPPTMRGLSRSLTTVVVVQGIQTVIVTSLGISAGHYLVSQVRVVIFLNIGFTILAERIRDVTTEDQLRDIAELHSAILAVTDRIADIFKPYCCIILSQYFIITLLSTIATMQAEHSPEITLILPICACFTCLYCFLGETLRRASQRVSDSVYFYAWHERTVAFQKNLAFILMRSQKPSYLRATLYGNISMPLILSFWKMWYRFLQALINTN